MVNTFKNLLLNEKADDIETFYTASGTQAQPYLFKWWHWVDTDHVYDLVKCFLIVELLMSQKYATVATFC